MGGVLLFGLCALPAWPADAPDLRVEVDLVRVPCVVTDRDGAPVRGLRPEDFVVLDNGAPQPLKYLWQEDALRLTLGVIVDVSGAGQWESNREIVDLFLSRVLGPGDRAFLATVGPQVKLVQDFTGSAAELQQAAESIDKRQSSGELFGESCTIPAWWRSGCWGTALWNAVYSASRLRMKGPSGRKALIVITDGWDRGSNRSLTEAIEAAQSAETLVYVIRSTPRLYKLIAGSAGLSAGHARDLKRLAQETGGRGFELHGNLSAIFDSIEQELRAQYVLAFTPPSDHRGELRRLKVTARRAGLSVRARQAYYAIP